MIGFEDKLIIAAYILTLLSAIVCIFYGIVNWKKGTTIKQQGQGTVTESEIMKNK